MVDVNGKVRTQWAGMVGVVMRFYREHGQRGRAYLRSRGFRTPPCGCSAQLHIEIGVMLACRDLVASGRMQYLWPECRYGSRFFELRAEVLLWRLRNESERVLAGLCTFIWPIACFRLCRELWWRAEEASTSGFQPEVLIAADLDDQSLDALAELLWAGSAAMN